ncbi:MAG: Gfo/Idh/MocA family oxidoreductase [Abditibacteriales bacterium]|nr:Gfo/Idh/MocA family oxidoreductase [Abditibacteriales bacterium]MDW8367749.1 Gfo/Idh/MocA family oxidoreductase [Abditibacteriales bacterium]
MPKTYRAAIIGCGSISKAHARGYQEVEETELVAVADVHPKALQERADEFNVRGRYRDYREMIEKEKPDIVSICLWQGLHAEVTVGCAEMKVPGILCEKPMATSLGEADAMIEAAQANGCKLAIGHQRRFLPTWNEAKRLLAAGVIGQPQMLYSRIADGLSNWGTHTVDCMRYMLNEVPTEWVIGQVERRTDRYERGQRIEDLCVGYIGFAGGVRAVLEADIQREGAGAFGITVYGSEGTLTFDERHLRLASPRVGGVKEMTMETGNPWAEQAREMCRWLDGTIERHRGHAANGRAVLEILMAVYESARVRGLVRMPLRTKEYPLDLAVEQGILPVEVEGKNDIRGFLVRKD